MNLEWHLDDELAERYASGALAVAQASSVEQHLLACEPCRAIIAPAVDGVRLERVWTQVLDRVQSPTPTPVEWLLHRLGVHESTARLIALTPSLRGSWFSGVVLLLSVSLFVSHIGPHGVAVFLAFAPLLPMLGVAVAFSNRTDSTFETATAAPYDGFRLLAVRAVVVVSSTVLLMLIAGSLLPDRPWLMLGWLLPALSLAVMTLAAAPRVQPLHTAAALTALWLAVALPGLRRGADPMEAVQSSVQLISLLALAVGIAVLVRRRSSPAQLRRNR